MTANKETLIGLIEKGRGLAHRLSLLWLAAESDEKAALVKMIGITNGITEVYESKLKEAHRETWPNQ